MKKGFFKLLAASLSATLLLSACNGTQTGTSSAGDAAGSADSNVTQTGTSSAGDAADPADSNVGAVTLEAGDTYTVISVKDYGDITVKLYPESAPVGVKQFIDLANSGYYNGKNIHRVISDFMLQGGSLNGDGMSGLPEGFSEFDVEYDYNMRHFYGALCYANAAGKNGAQFYIVNNKTSTDVSPFTEELWNSYLAQAEETIAQAKELGEGYEMYVTYYETQAEMYRKMAEYAANRTEEITKQYAEQGGTPSLDGGYTVFGQTVDGFDVIDKISAVEVADNGNGENSSPVTEIIIDSVKIYTK